MDSYIILKHIFLKLIDILRRLIGDQRSFFDVFLRLVGDHIHLELSTPLS